MKTTYKSPKIEIIDFELEDIMTVSKIPGHEFGSEEEEYTGYIIEDIDYRTSLGNKKFDK